MAHTCDAGQHHGGIANCTYKHAGQHYHGDTLCLVTRLQGSTTGPVNVKARDITTVFVNSAPSESILTHPPQTSCTHVQVQTQHTHTPSKTNQPTNQPCMHMQVLPSLALLPSCPRCCMSRGRARSSHHRPTCQGWETFSVGGRASCVRVCVCACMRACVYTCVRRACARM